MLKRHLIILSPLRCIPRNFISIHTTVQPYHLNAPIRFDQNHVHHELQVICIGKHLPGTHAFKVLYVAFNGCQPVSTDHICCEFHYCCPYVLCHIVQDINSSLS
nr:MAG TPA: hypothetical protein [Caudoviricetes sp.]